MSQKERVDLIEVDLLDMCKYILSKWVFILIGMVVFAGAGFGYAKVKGKTEYSSRMKVYVTIPKTSDKVLIRDSASELTYDYVSLAQTDLILDKVAKESKVPRKIVRDALQAVVVDGTRIIEFQIDTSNKETISVKEFTIIGAIAGFVVMVGISLILHLIVQIKKTKKNLV